MGQGFRFALVGSATAIIFVSLVVAGDRYALPSLATTVSAYVVAISFQYVAHAVFTFRRAVAVPDQLGRFLLTTGIGLLFSIFIIDMLGPHLGWPAWLRSAVVVVVMAV